jgi:hypothetical protein
MPTEGLEAEIKLPLKTMLTKAAIDSTTLPNSVLNRQQSNRFIDLVVDTSVLLKNVRTVKVDAPKGEINKLDLGQVVTEGANTTSSNTTTTPTERTVEYDTEKYRSAFDLKTDFIEDNIEGTGARDTIINMFTKAISNDTELAAISSDNSLVTGDAQSRTNNLLGVNDGFTKILLANTPSGQIIDCTGRAPSKKLFYDMKRRIPKKYRVAKPAYRWLVSSGVFDKWSYDWSGRETPGGDSALANGQSPGPFGINMIEIPLMPEDLSYSGSSNTRTDIWMTPPSNLIVFIQREVTIEWDRRPRRDVWEATIHFRLDFQVENADLVVYAKNIDLTGADY